MKGVGGCTLFDGASSGSSPSNFFLDKNFSIVILLGYLHPSIPSLPYVQVDMKRSKCILLILIRLGQDGGWTQLAYFKGKGHDGIGSC